MGNSFRGETYHIRASSWAELLDCPLRWQKKNLEGIKAPSTPPALIGSAVHASTAAFDQSRIDGAGLTVDDTAAIAVDYLANPDDDDVNWRGMNQVKAEETALHVHTEYCRKISPTQNYLIVEKTLDPLEINMGGGVLIELTGTLDRIRQAPDGRKGVADVKTGVAAVRADETVIVGKHAPQLATYQLLAEDTLKLELDLPPAIIGLQTSKAPRAGIGSVHHTRESLLGTATEPGLLDFAALYFKSGLFPPNPNSWICGERYCPYYARCRHHG